MRRRGLCNLDKPNRIKDPGVRNFTKQLLHVALCVCVCVCVCVFVCVKCTGESVPSLFVPCVCVFVGVNVCVNV
jgi:hypothetical protein